MAAEIGPTRPILIAKFVLGNQFWQKFLPKSVRLDGFYRGTNFDVTGHRAISSYIARSVEVMISQYLIHLD